MSTPRIHTVATLIDALQKFSPDMPVCAYDGRTESLRALLVLELVKRGNAEQLYIGVNSHE